MTKITVAIVLTLATLATAYAGPYYGGRTCRTTCSGGVCTTQCDNGY